MNTTSTVAVPVVGMPAYFSIGSDTYPATVVSVSPSGHKVVVQEAKYRRTDSNGYSESQSYIVLADPEGALKTFTRRGDGAYRGAGGKSYRLYIGKYAAYSDPSF